MVLGLGMQALTTTSGMLQASSGQLLSHQKPHDAASEVDTRVKPMDVATLRVTTWGESDRKISLFVAATVCSVPTPVCSMQSLPPKSWQHSLMPVEGPTLSHTNQAWGRRRGRETESAGGLWASEQRCEYSEETRRLK